MKSFRDVAEVEAFITDQNIEFINFFLGDIDGRLRSVSIPAETFSDKIMERGIGFDASNFGFAQVDHSDKVLKPDLKYGFVDPVRSHQDSGVCEGPWGASVRIQNHRRDMQSVHGFCGPDVSGLGRNPKEAGSHSRRFGPYETNLYDLPEEELSRIRSFPSSLGEALDALEEDRGYLTDDGIFPDYLLDEWVATKRKDIEEMRVVPPSLGSSPVLRHLKLPRPQRAAESTHQEPDPWQILHFEIPSPSRKTGQRTGSFLPNMSPSPISTTSSFSRSTLRGSPFSPERPCGMYRSFSDPHHLQQVASILDDPESSPNDRGVALALLRNAEVAAQGILPFCQDTGTATIYGKKGQQIWTGGKDEEALSKGVFQTYTQENLRYSQTVPLTMYEERNSGNNLPAQIDLHATGGMEYKFLFVAKGGGSANKTYLFQETKALLNPDTLIPFLTEKMKTLGTAACPPYHLAFVIGGTSAEANLKTVKLAGTHYLDGLPRQGNEMGQAFRDVELEDQLLKEAQKTGIGAQFGGKYFALDVRVVRLPRHGASCPVGMGVSCSAHRNVKAKINREGTWIEELERNPGRFIPDEYRGKQDPGVVSIDLNRPMAEVLAELRQHPVKTRLSLTGTLVVGRDIAHAKIKERLDAGEEIPQYLKDHPIYYAGPAKTPEGWPSGSFGPTTAGRMDSYVDLFQSRGGSMIMIAKGNRSQQVTDACKKNGGFYLGSIGGPAAVLAKENIKKVELLEYPELGMEAIYRIEVEDFPAFILVDDKGNDFFRQIM